jgi:hypothetical protein
LWCSLLTQIQILSPLQRISLRKVVLLASAVRLEASEALRRLCSFEEGAPKVVKQTLQDFLIKDYISRYVFVLNTSIYFPIEYTIYIYIYVCITHIYFVWNYIAFSKGTRPRRSLFSKSSFGVETGALWGSRKS